MGPAGLRYVVTMLETSPFIVAQQPADTDPHPAFAPLRQLLKVHALIVGVVRQENEQATFEVKDHIAQIHDVFPFPVRRRARLISPDNSPYAAG